MFFDLAKPHHAYMFGFLQTDANHYQGKGQKGRISIEISARDRPILDAFKAIVPWNSTITTRTRSTNFAAHYQSATWRLCSLDARRELLSLGLLTGKKSREIAPPTVEFSRIDYFRGLIDGDGSIGFTAAGHPFVGLVTASDAIAEFFCAEVRSVAGAIRTAKRNTRDKVFNLMVANDPAKTLAGALYYDNCLALPRKLASAHQIATWVRPSGMRARPTKRRTWTHDEDQVVLRMSVVEAAKLLDRTESSVNTRRFRLRRGIAHDRDDTKLSRFK